MTRPVLKAVPAAEKSIRTQSIRIDQTKRITSIRAQLLRLAVAYVVEGKDGTRNDRLRTASELSGIPLKLIDVESENS